MDYPLVVYTSVLRAEAVARHETVADYGSKHKWTELIEFLNDSKDLVNSCRLPVDETTAVDLCTPLHHAAKGKAEKKFFKELMKLGASKTLKNAEGNTAYDIAKQNGLSADILELIEIPKKIREKNAEIEKMEGGLHKTILGRVEDLIKKNGQQLPQLGYLYEYGDFYYPVPGMYGGFSISKHENGVQAESWCRVAGGSGQRHEIDREGNVELVDEGFV